MFNLVSGKVAEERGVISMASRLRRFGGAIGAVALLVSGCGGSVNEGLSGGEGEDQEQPAAATAAPLTPALLNSPTTLDQKYLPGMGYLDGTTCDVWPRDVSFATDGDNMGVIEAVLSRYSISSSVVKLKAMTSRLRNLLVTHATVVGSKYELLVTEGKRAGTEPVLVAIDEATKQGFFVDNEWLCSEELLRLNPLNCKEHTVRVGSVDYAVLGRTEKKPPALSGFIRSDVFPLVPPKTLVLVAPQIRFAPRLAGGELVSSSYLLAIGQRVYGGSRYVAGEDLSKRTSDSAKVTVTPSVPPIPELPDSTTWRRALREARQPGFVAIIGDEVGGISELKATAPATVESLVISHGYTDDARYDPVARILYVRPKTYFDPTYQAQQVVRNGHSQPMYTVKLVANARERAAGGSGAAFLLAGSSPKTTSVMADEGSALTVGYSSAALRSLLLSYLRPWLDTPNVTYQVNFDLGTTSLGYVSGEGWTNGGPFTSAADYREDIVAEIIGKIAAEVDSAFPPGDPLFEPMARADAGTDTAVRQVSMGAQLFSRGAFADVLFGRSELESLRSGEVAASWADTWRLMNDYNLGSIRIPDYDPAVDYNLDPARRRRAAQMAAYVEIAPKLKGGSNVLGLPYGQSASGWFTSAADGVPSIYAAEKRWNQLGSLVSQFQSAADASDDLASAAQRDALVQLVSALNDGLKRDIGNTSKAASTVAAAAHANASTQKLVLEDFKKGYDKLFELNNGLQTKMNEIWGCDPTFTPEQCIGAAKAKMSQLEQACSPSTGLDWMRPFVDLASSYIPAIAVANAAVKTYTGKDLVGAMTTLLEDPESAGGMIAGVVDTFVPVTDFAKEFEEIDKYVGMAGYFSKGMHKILDEAPRTCKAGGQPQTDMENFRAQVVLVDNMMQNYTNQIGLVHGMISAQLAHIGYLGTEGTAYDELAASQSQNLASLNATTQPLLGKLRGMSDFNYSAAAAEIKSFMTNACQTAVRATRASQADLHMISQALQTSTGAAVTKPHLVLPAKAAWHFASNASGDPSQTDQYFGFGMSLWDRAAFDARFTPAGSASTTPYLSQAGTRFAQLMNGEVCTRTVPKPETRYVVRKVITGQALRTLVSAGQLDVSVTLDDIVASAQDGSNVTKGVVAQNLNTQAYDMKLEGGFVISTGFSVCNGAAGKECSSRVASNKLATVAGGKLNKLIVANRGRGYVPMAVGELRTAGGGTRLACRVGQQMFEATNPLQLGSATKSVSSCFTPVLTPRAWASAAYWDNAGAPDAQVLNNHTEICAVDAQTLAGRPLQGLPVLGTWGLTTSEVTATALASSMAASPISSATLPDPALATAVEVLFVVGAEPIDSGSSGGYTLKP